MHEAPSSLDSTIIQTGNIFFLQPLYPHVDEKWETASKISASSNSLLISTNQELTLWKFKGGKEKI